MKNYRFNILYSIFAFLFVAAASNAQQNSTQNQNTPPAQSQQVQAAAQVQAATQTQVASSLSQEKSKIKKVALFVRNDSGKKVLDDKVKMLEYTLSAHINNMGYGVVNHDLVLRNLNAYLGNPNTQYKTQAQSVRDSLENNRQLDVSLFENASGLRLSEMIGADYILSVSYASLGSQKKTFTGYGVNSSNLVYTLRSNYNLYENGGGVGTAGGVVKAQKAVNQNANITTQSDDDINELIDDTAMNMAQVLNRQNKASQIIAKEASSGEVNLRFIIDAFTFPEVIKNSDGNFQIGQSQLPISVTYVTAEIDGIAQNLGAKTKLAKGIHTLRVRQQDLEPVELNIFVTGDPNQTLNLSLSLSKEARNRWKEDMAFMELMKAKAQEVENKRLLTEGEVKKLEGIAKALENSGYKVDFKVDAKNLPDIKQVQSVFGQ